MARSAVDDALATATTNDWWAWWAVWLIVGLIAWLGNPTPASFRTHLTSMSFHQHLRRLSSPARNGITPTASQSTPSTSSARPAPVKATKDSPSPKKPSRSSQPSHVLSFSNRISLAVKTPPYTYKSYVFFSIVVMSPANASRSKRRKAASGAAAPEGLIRPHTEVWVGAFGRWYAWKLDNDELEEEERRGRVARGVVSIEAEVDEDKDSEVAPSPTVSTHPAESTDSSAAPISPIIKSSRQTRSGKRVMRAGQRRASPASLARLRSKAEASSAATSANASNASSTCATPAAEAASTADDCFFRKRAGSGQHKNGAGATGAGNENAHTKTTSTSSLTGVNKADPAGAGSNSVGTSTSSSAATAAATADIDDIMEGDLKVDESDPVLVELRMQVDELKSASRDTERRLQEELEILRAKKKDEDATRSELKAKTRELEEQKRDADLLRIEAERVLNDKKGKVREAQDRVDKLRGEIKKIDKREMELIERKEKKKRDRKEREKKLREDVSKKKDELLKAQSGFDEVMSKVSELERTVTQRREVLQTKRNDQTARRMGFGVVNALGPADHRVVSAPLPHSGSYGRLPPVYTSVHPSSRPSSIRSGYGNRFDTSAPSSPTVARATAPYADAYAPYGEQQDRYLAGPGFGPAYNVHPAVHAPTGFLEHRLQHRRNEIDLLSQPHAIVSTLPSSNDIPTSFTPFDDSRDHSPVGGTSKTRPSSLYDETSGQRRPQLALPLQYLESGLLDTTDSPGLDGPLSPMTPHQTSLIPSQLFQMLDEDDDDEFVMPDSPTIAAGQQDLSRGLGLDVDGEIKRSTVGASGALKSPVSLLSPISPVSPTSPVSAASEGSTPGFHRATQFAPWDGGDVLLSSRLPDMSGVHGSLLGKDDLSRAGLSLNPDAKAFASQLPATSSTMRGTVTRTSSHSPSPSSDSAQSPIVASDLPTKSRMEFSSTRSMPSPLGAAPAMAAVNGETVKPAFNPFGDE
ncbi:hypothetical protein ACM66B_004692 [Microbotryomycetes sp. NB124-2]